MHWTERRQRFRAVLAGGRCVHPGSVHDPISARIAEDLGFEVGMFAGSVASMTVLGAPDLITLTLSEFAAQGTSMSKSASASRLLSCNELCIPPASRRKAPGSAGIELTSINAPHFEARSISLRWPANPKPDTSVTAVVPQARRMAIASALDWSMDAVATSSSRVGNRARMCAASTVPVPSALVRSTAWPVSSPDFSNAGPESSVPVIVRLNASSAASAEWPPTRATLCVLSTSTAPLSN